MVSLEIGIDSFASALADSLINYTTEIAEEVKKETDRSMRQLVSLTKNDAPELTGDYKKSITSKTVHETQFSKTKVWYVKNGEHTLTHLLEDGHALRNGGRAEAHPHIRKNVAVVTEQYEKNVKEIIKNASK